MTRSEENAHPVTMRLERTSDGVLITRKWRNMAAYALTPQALLASGFSVAIFLKTQGLGWDDPVRWIPVALGVAALGTLYYPVTRFVNRTSVRITPEWIEIRHGPLPRWRSSRIDAGGIGRVFVKQHLIPSRGGRKLVQYHVWALRKDGSEMVLVDGEVEEAQARFFEREMEQALGRGRPGENH